MQALAITQGDSAGIGPEIIAKAFRDAPQHMQGCFVVGEMDTMRRAAQCIAGPGQPSLPVALVTSADEALAVPPQWRLLLCSDGVHHVVPAQELASALQAASPHDALHELHLAALRGGADDNLSIAVVDILARQPVARTPRHTRHDLEVSS